jgi:tetratricopeptide (TPR) repeat protein
MLKTRLLLLLLLVGCFSLATWLDPRHAASQKRDDGSGGVLALILGDGRKMFANEVFARADAYFHRGNYPSIFDTDRRHTENHMAGEAGAEAQGPASHEDEAPAAPQDWIARFGSHFRPTQHAHLESGAEREMLPWLRLCAELDPHRTQTYTVTAYWMRTRLNKVNEAESFLRQGLEANPHDPELLYELGRLIYENRKEPGPAHNIWLDALGRWHMLEAPKPEPNKLLLQQILGGLAAIEVQSGHPRDALPYLQQLKEVSPSPEEIQKRIEELQAAPPDPPAP